MRGVGGGDIDDVDGVVGEQFAVVGEQPLDPELCPGLGQGGLVGVDEGDDLDPRVPLPAGDVGATGPPPGSDHGNAKLLTHRNVPFLRPDFRADFDAPN